MSNVQEKYIRLLSALTRKTSSAALEWVLDEWDDPYVEVGNRKIFLETVENKSETYIVVRVADENGNLIDRFTDRDLRGMPLPMGASSFFEFMKNLRNSAVRQASGADKALDDLISELDEE